MLDPKLFLDEDGSAGVEAALKDRGVELDLSGVRSLAEERKTLRAEADELKNRLNVGSKEIGLLMRDGKKAEAEERKAEMKTSSSWMALPAMPASGWRSMKSTSVATAPGSGNASLFMRKK